MLRNGNVFGEELLHVAYLQHEEYAVAPWSRAIEAEPGDVKIECLAPVVGDQRLTTWSGRLNIPTAET
jgi:hypothetical protein